MHSRTIVHAVEFTSHHNEFSQHQNSAIDAAYSLGIDCICRVFAFEFRRKPRQGRNGVRVWCFRCIFDVWTNFLGQMRCTETERSTIRTNRKLTSFGILLEGIQCVCLFLFIISVQSSRRSYAACFVSKRSAQISQMARWLRSSNWERCIAYVHTGRECSQSICRFVAIGWILFGR